jgi:hypothetical protein
VFPSWPRGEPLPKIGFLSLFSHLANGTFNFLSAPKVQAMSATEEKQDPTEVHSEDDEEEESEEIDQKQSMPSAKKV